MTRELGVATADLLDEPLGVLAPDIDVDRVAERARGRERVLDDRVDEHSNTMTTALFGIEMAGRTRQR